MARTDRQDMKGPDVRFAAELARLPRPDPMAVRQTRHALARFSERIDASVNPEIGLRQLIWDAMESVGRVEWMAGKPPCRILTVRDAVVVLTADFRSVLTVYRSDNSNIRSRWYVSSCNTAAVA
jgi:hypothetical protein